MAPTLMSTVKKGLFSSALLVAESISKKMIGVVSTLVLARVLVPEDFGLVAIATLYLGLLDVLTDTGTTQYLLRSDKLDEETVNTSWTINLILKGILSVVMVVSAPFVSQYYEDSRLTPILYVLSCLIIVRCLNNPGVAFLRREQNYKSLVKLSIIAKFFSVGVAVSIALTFESYWALILGQCANGLMMVIGSYFIHDHRPSLTLANAKEQWSFSGWMIPQSVLGYFRTQLDTIMVSSTFGKEALGSYHIMKYLAFIPSSQILLPATQPLLVELNKTKNDANAFSRQFNISFVVTMILALPITGLMVSQHELITLVFLGNKWIDYSQLLAYFSLLIPAVAMLNQGRRVLVVYGKTKQMLYYEILSFTLLYGSLFSIGMDDLLFFSLIRVGIENALCLLFLAFIALTYTGFKNTLILLFVCIPLILATILASLATSYLNVGSGIILFDLIVTGLIFVIVFFALLLVFHYSFMRRTVEWKYIESLANRSLGVILQRFQ
jgi:lipopolysaccharide exporter